MKLKDGVILAGLDFRMRKALIVADSVYRSYGRELVITSGLDGVHSARSLHYYGLAIDCRTNYFTDNQTILRVAKDIQKNLPIIYNVVVELTHIHIEYDVTKIEKD
jgi:hypothetical protein